MEQKTKKFETHIPREMKKLLMDLNITFLDWCRVNQFTRETARNVAAGIIKGNCGKSVTIKSQLLKDFPEIFEPKKVGTEKTQKARHNRLRRQVVQFSAAKAGA